MEKTPFVLDPRPLPEASSPHAGALGTSRAFRAIGYPGLIGSVLNLRRRRRGFTEAQMIESIVLLQTIEYVCNGVASIFIELEPLGGNRHVSITERRTRVDWAHFIRGMLEDRYRDNASRCSAVE